MPRRKPRPYDRERDAELLERLQRAIHPARDYGQRAALAVRSGREWEAREAAALAAMYGRIWQEAITERTERVEGRICRDASFCWT